MRKPLIEKKFIRISYGDIAYLETGSDRKPPVLFVHGIPTSGFLWREVIRTLQNDFHCYAPDLMGLGDTDVDPDSDCFHMDAQAEMLLEFMNTLGHQRFSVVCHDQGGAAVQILAARRPDVFESLVITDCVCYDNWPVPKIAQLQSLSRIPLLMEGVTRTGFFDFLETRTSLSAFRRGMCQPERFRDEAIREYLRPLVSGAKPRLRFLRFLQAGHARYTLQAVEGLRKFQRPTIILWAADDFYLSPSWGRKLLDDIPGAERMELVPFCGHFWQEEKPAEFASLMGAFLARTVPRAEAGTPEPRKHVAKKAVRGKEGEKVS
jgi:pimeloyl-ACP methyl ester carboxylesterase